HHGCRIIRAPMSPRYSFGPQIEAGGARFRLWAPRADKILLEIEGRPPIPMDTLADGWKEAVAPVEPGARYRFRIGDVAVPDPASRRQEGGVHGWSVLCAPGTVSSWRGRPWEETVLYEVHAGLAGGYAGLEN